MVLRMLAFFVSSLVLLAAGGCHGPRVIEIDGRFDDWPARSDGRGMQAADAYDLWFCFELPQTITLQGLNRLAEIQLLIDVDHRNDTGMHWESDGRQLGVDLRVVFSPIFEGRPGNAVAVDIFPAEQRSEAASLMDAPAANHSPLADRVGGGGQDTDALPRAADALHSISVDTAGESRLDAGPARVGHADVGLIFAPTFASDRFEVRLSRQHLAEALATHGGASPGSRMRAVLVLNEPGVAPVVWNEFSFRGLPPMRAWVPAGEAVAPAAAGALRVMVHNVENSAPREEPGPFSRFWRALVPDVVLIQEWYDAEPEELTAWAAEHVDGAATWHAVIGPGGVAVVSRYPLTQVLVEPLWVPEELRGSWTRGDRPVRFVAAKVDAPRGSVVTASMHLTCCGFAGSPEDDRRIGEATVIARALESLAEEERRRMIIGGDVNLVGSENPLRLMVDGRDFDGSDMAVVATPVRGSRLWYTWFEAPNRFSPGRLDWMWYTDSSVRLVKSLALDTQFLSSEALERMELNREDSRSSDHLIMLGDFVLER